MKIVKFFNQYIALLFLIAGAMAFASCNDNNDSAGGSPEIDGVRVTDPTKADSLFAQMPAGRMIVIVGKNLQNAKKVYINDQDVFFNANYNTSTHIIITIPAESDGFILTYFNPGLKPEIRVETDHGTATYQFLVTFPFPAITAIDAVTYPTPTGDSIRVTGTDLVDIKKAYFTNVDPNNPAGGGVQIIVPNFTVYSTRVDYVTTSIMKFALPDLPRDANGNFFGYFVVECAASTASFKYQTLPDPSITSISSDMPIPGMKVTINGLFFVDVDHVDINNGEIIIPAKDMDQVTRTQLIFTMPAKPSQTCDLKVVAANGEAVRKNFYPYGQLLTNFDDIGKYESWSGADVQFLEADPANPPYISDGKYASTKGTYGGTWWAGATIMYKDSAQVENILPSFDYIPAETPSSEVYLAYECYNRIPFNGSTFIRCEFEQVGFSGAFAYFNYDWGTNKTADVSHPDYTGVALFDQWYTAMIPLSKFAGFETASYKDIYNKGIVMLQFVVINPGSAKNDVDICFDNVRFITIPKLKK